MVSFITLSQQNDYITEQAQVLNYLIADRAICDSSITRDLFFSYVEQVRTHLDIEERELYQKLLTHSDSKVRNIANKFLAGSGEIKRVLAQYVKRWTKNHQLLIKDHPSFVKDTNEMCELVLRRIEDEIEHLYPAVRLVRSDFYPEAKVA